MPRRGPRAAPHRKPRLAGFSLVELLVAVLVMGVGVLGVVGLMALGMQGNRSAMLATEAALLAEDMMDRIRANSGRHSGGNRAVALYGGLALGDPPPPYPDCRALECTAEQMAAFDRAVWKCRLGRFAERPGCIDLADAGGLVTGGEPTARSGLPEGDGAIAVDSGGAVVGVMVQWRDRREIRSVSVESSI